jgi:LCP family protein required for cell wall assembly
LALLEYAVFHPWRALTVLMVGTLLGLGSFYAYQVSAALGAVAVEEFDPDIARSAIETGGGAPTTTVFSIAGVYVEPAYDVGEELELIAATLASIPESRPFNLAASGEPIDDGVFDAYLLVGSDASGRLADAIILTLQPTDGGKPIMVSLPRDLYVWNLCKRSFTRLNSGLGGCSGVASGSELLAIMVQDYTGIPIDHLARINFDGFARVVDAMGGITVCVDYPTRDPKSHLLIEVPGCQTAGGETALAWVRSRQPEQLIGEEWQPAGGSDFTRQRNQQDVLFQLAGRAAGFSSPASLAAKLEAVAASVRLDSSWSLGQAVSTAWRYRGISKDSVKRFSISVREYRTSYGAAVLLPAKPFKEHLSAVYDLG